MVKQELYVPKIERPLFEFACLHYGVNCDVHCRMQRGETTVATGIYVRAVSNEKFKYFGSTLTVQSRHNRRTLVSVKSVY